MFTSAQRIQLADIQCAVDMINQARADGAMGDDEYAMAMNVVLLRIDALDEATRPGTVYSCPVARDAPATSVEVSLSSVVDSVLDEVLTDIAELDDAPRSEVVVDECVPVDSSIQVASDDVAEKSVEVALPTGSLLGVAVHALSTTDDLLEFSGVSRGDLDYLVESRDALIESATMSGVKAEVFIQKILGSIEVARDSGGVVMPLMDEQHRLLSGEAFHPGEWVSGSAPFLPPGPGDAEFVNDLRVLPALDFFSDFSSFTEARDVLRDRVLMHRSTLDRACLDRAWPSGFIRPEFLG